MGGALAEALCGAVAVGTLGWASGHVGQWPSSRISLEAVPEKVRR